VRITYTDRGTYAGTVSALGFKTYKFDHLNAPAIGLGEGVAYDSSVAYDKMARAALAFADHYLSRNRLRSFHEVADYDESGDFAVTRKRARR
jgi:hypothetical protein